MEDNHFEDTGIFYANQDMVDKGIVLSMNTGLVYNLENAEDVKIIKKVSGAFFDIAKKDIADDGPCFYGGASIYREILTGDAEIRNLIWEL